MTFAAAEAAGYDWWFTGGVDTDRTPTGPSTTIYLNKVPATCLANPGETYSADYLGLVPPEGCADVNDCVAALRVIAGPVGGLAPQGGARGTCLCATP